MPCLAGPTCCRALPCTACTEEELIQQLGGPHACADTVLTCRHPPCTACTAEELYQQLEGLGIRREAPHPVFGKIGELLKTFCARRRVPSGRARGRQMQQRRCG